MTLAMLLTQAIDRISLAYWQFDRRGLRWIDGTMTVIYTVLPAFLFVLLYAGRRRRTRVGMGPLAVGVSAYGLYNLVIESSSQGNRFTGFQWPHAVDTWTVSLMGYPIGIRSLLDALCVLTLLMTLARLYAADRARRTALE